MIKCMVLKQCEWCDEEFFIYPCREERGTYKCCSNSCSTNLLWKDKNYRNKNVVSHTGNTSYWKGKRRPDIGEKVAKKLRGRKQNLSPEQLEKKSENSKKYGYQKGHVHSREVLEKIRKARVNQVLPREYTSIEKKVYSLLEEVEINFTPQYPLEGICVPDAFIEPKTAIFCDGDYWHNLPNYKKRDAKINEKLKDLGYRVVRLWEHEINDDISFCLERILNEV